MKTKRALCAFAAAFAIIIAFLGCAAPSPVPSSVPFPTESAASSSPALQSEPPPEPPVPAPHTGPGEEMLAPRMEEICRDWGVTGMSLAVFDAGGVFYQQSWGYAVKESQTPADENTIYRAASISKAVTALLALDLVGKGELDLDAPLPELGGVLVQNPNFPEDPITLRQLLTHTSGILDSWSYWQAVQSPSLPTLDRVLPQSYGDYPPGVEYSYSNFAMGLVSGVMESVTGSRFLDYTRDQVFAPMGMDAAYSYDGIHHRERVADLYEGGRRSQNLRQWDRMSAKYVGLPPGQLYALGHGDLFITARDLCRFCRILAGCPQPGEPVSLTPELLEGVQTVQYEHPEPLENGFLETKRGLGTHITDHLVEGRRMAGHQGNAYGSISGMFFDPEAQCGFVFLTNGASDAVDQYGLYLVNRDVARAVFTAFFGYEETPAAQSH